MTTSTRTRMYLRDLQARGTARRAFAHIYVQRAAITRGYRITTRGYHERLSREAVTTRGYHERLSQREALSCWCLVDRLGRVDAPQRLAERVLDVRLAVRVRL
eukprot:2644214-Prymnesium_polylepis.1